MLEIFETDVGELGSEGAEKVEIISSDCEPNFFYRMLLTPRFADGLLWRVVASFPMKYKKIRGRAIRDAQAIVGASYEEQKVSSFPSNNLGRLTYLTSF